jgi:hypothetical protein
MDLQHDGEATKHIVVQCKREALGSLRRAGMLMAALCAVMSTLTLSFAEDRTSIGVAGRCDVGPLNKTFGMTHWLVYSCTSDLNVVIVSATGNPALPFIFVFLERNGAYELHGEGTGDKMASEAAFKELQSLSRNDISALIADTKTAQQKDGQP